MNPNEMKSMCVEIEAFLFKAGIDGVLASELEYTMLKKYGSTGRNVVKRLVEAGAVRSGRNDKGQDVLVWIRDSPPDGAVATGTETIQ